MTRRRYTFATQALSAAQTVLRSHQQRNDIPILHKMRPQPDMSVLRQKKYSLPPVNSIYLVQIVVRHSVGVCVAESFIAMQFCS